MTNDVFQRLLALVTSLLVKPLERNFVDSLDRFLLGRVMHADGTPLESILYGDEGRKDGRDVGAPLRWRLWRQEAVLLLHPSAHGC